MVSSIRSTSSIERRPMMYASTAPSSSHEPPTSTATRRAVTRTQHRSVSPQQRLAVGPGMPDDHLTTDIGKEARELALRMQAELAQVRSSVDLLVQTDRALVLSADRHFHLAARCFYHMSHDTGGAQPAAAAGRDGPAQPPTLPPPAYHFAPLPTPLHYHLHPHQSLARRTEINVSPHTSLPPPAPDASISPRRDEPQPISRLTTSASLAGSQPPMPLATPGHGFAEGKPPWNVSTQPAEALLPRTTPLSVTEPTKEWLASKRKHMQSRALTDDRQQRRSSSADDARPRARGLRFKSPDGTVTNGGGPGGRTQNAANLSITSRPVLSLHDTSAERNSNAVIYGRSTTGLWSQAAERSANQPPPAAPWLVRSDGLERAQSGGSADASANTSRHFVATAADASSRVLGLALSQKAADSSQGTDDETFARKHLHHMNIPLVDPTGSAGVAPLDQPLWNGVVLLRLVNMISLHYLPKQQHLKSLPVRSGPGVTFEDARSNFLNALTRIRDFPAPTCGCDPVPPHLLYLDTCEVLSGNEGQRDMWALLAKLIEAYVLKVDRSEPARGDDVQGGQNAAALQEKQALRRVPVVGRYCDVYSSRNMFVLEDQVCLFLLQLHVLADPAQHHMPLDDDPSSSNRLPGPLSAPFLPEKRIRWHFRTTTPSTISLASIFPFFTNGTLLCDVVSSILSMDVPVYRNPRIRNNCIANITSAQTALRKYYPSRISNAFLVDPLPVYEGDKAFILFLMEDMMRFACKAPPRKVLPNRDQVPFMLPSHWHQSADLAALQGASILQAVRTHGSKTDSPSAANSEPHISTGMAHASHHAMFPQKERQPFVAEERDDGHRWTLAELAQQREGSIGSQTGTGDVADVTGGGNHRSTTTLHTSTFTTTHSNPPPKSVRLRSIGVTTTAPSSGRSIVPSDEIQDELDDDPQEVLPALLPRHLEYLLAMHVDERELQQHSEWLHVKLGFNYRYTSQDGIIDIQAKNGPLALSHPCFIFADGVVLCHLVRILSYQKCPQLDNIQANPKTVAAKRNNIKKVLEYLRNEKKTLVDYVFLEDVLITGDLRAVVLVLRSLRQTYKNHISSRR